MSNQSHSPAEIVFELTWVLIWVTGAVIAKGFWSTFFAVTTGGFYSLYLVIESVLLSLGVIS